MGSKGPLAFFGSRDRLGRIRKSDEETVALGVDLDPAVAREGLSKQPPVIRQSLCVAVAECVQEPGRPFDVGEEKRDAALRKIGHAVQRVYGGPVPPPNQPPPRPSPGLPFLTLAQE